MRDLTWRDAAILSVLFVVLTTAVTLTIPWANDWSAAFCPAIHAIWRGENPYTMYDVHNPPWAYIILTPVSFDAAAYDFLQR